MWSYVELCKTTACFLSIQLVFLLKSKLYIVWRKGYLCIFAVSLCLTSVNTITSWVGVIGRDQGRNSRLQMMDILFKAFLPTETSQETRTELK